MTANLRHAAGSLLVVGLSGLELTGLERAWLKLVRPAGIILFRRNIADAAQTRALLSSATAICAPHALRCVDVEGGTVDRLREALAPMPSAQSVFIAARRTGKLSLMREHGELIARSIKAFGFNTTLAPVLDLALPASAKVMGTRAVSADPQGVIEYGRAFLEGLAAYGVVGCGKHFPGLGAGTLDSHLETPKIERSLRKLSAEDLEPFRALHKQLPMIMVNHAAYPNTRSRHLPASVSPYWITKVLRKQIGYRGIIFSDDLEMGGILNAMPIEDAVIAAVRAGMDIVEICHSPELILRAYESLIAESERSSAFRKLLLLREAESATKRRRLLTEKQSAALSSNQFKSLQQRIVQFSESISQVLEAQTQ